MPHSSRLSNEQWRQEFDRLTALRAKGLSVADAATIAGMSPRRAQYILTELPLRMDKNELGGRQRSKVAAHFGRPSKAIDQAMRSAAQRALLPDRRDLTGRLMGDPAQPRCDPWQPWQPTRSRILNQLREMGL